MSSEFLPPSFREWMSAHQKTAWRPRTEEGQSPKSNSWFGGTPVVSTDDDWPDCIDCGSPMRFFLQLDAADLPYSCDLMAKGQILQLFYCSEDDGCQTWEPFFGAQEVRSFLEEGVSIEPPDDLLSFPRKSIIGWEVAKDFPHGEEHKELGMELTYEWSSNSLKAVSRSFGDSQTKLPSGIEWTELIPQPVQCDKLGGWPAWVQGPEYPDCPICGKRMQLIFQIDSDDHLPFAFGDVGCGHLTMCIDHPQVAAFGWACY